MPNTTTAPIQTSSPLTRSTGAGSSGSSASGSFLSQMMASGISNQLAQAILTQATPHYQSMANPLPTSSSLQTPSGAQSTGETVVGYIAAGLLFALGVYMLVSASPRTIHIVGAMTPSQTVAPAKAAEAAA